MKDTRELRAFLTDQMNKVASGEVDPEKVKGVANLAQQIYNTINIEIKLALAKRTLGDTAIAPVMFNGD